jgi:predicted RecB family nuclease
VAQPKPVVLLSGYAAKQCARRIHNDWDTTIPQEPWQPSPQMQLMFDEGLTFQDSIFDELQGVLGERLLVINSGLSKQAAISATVDAMDAGAEVIAEGWLPDDVAGARTGRPDLLVKMNARNGSSFYAPGDIKAHKTVKEVASGRLTYSLPSDPGALMVVDGLAEEIAGCFDDFLQLAHYSRMLDAAGYGPRSADLTDESRLGFIIGRDALADWVGSDVVLVWHDLTVPHFKTFSRSSGSAKRSALERYDHEHGFRVKVAQVAQLRVGAPSDPEPLVVPIGQAECLECPWEAFCGPLLDGVASGEISSGRLNVREWLTLQSIGVVTTEDLAAVDVDDPAWLASYLDLVPHQVSAEKRLREAVTRAQMIGAGEQLRRTSTGELDVPQADIEIDFDIEWDIDNRVYLWGARIRQGQDDATAQYVPFVSWEALDDASELALAHGFIAWLRDYVESARRNGQSLAVFHYTSPEVRYLRKILGEDAVADVLEYFVDLYALMQEHFIGVEGLGIKKVAAAFGFAWRDDDPGGLQSQVWLEQVRVMEDAQAPATKTRILEYNEDDVAATAALRDGLRRSKFL